MGDISQMKYTPTEILSIQFQSMTQLRKLTRAEFFTRLQLVRTIEPIVDEAFRISEEKTHAEQLDNEPHGQPWHVSFHASQFPGDNPMACSRKALYTMMDFAEPAPTSRRLRQTAEAGKAVEASLVYAWHKAGMLISSPDPEDQTGFQIPDAWFTGSVDAVIVPPGWNKPLPIEVKNRSAQTIAEMKLGARGPFPEHVSQIKAQLGFIRFYQDAGVLHLVKGNFPENLEPVTHGFIYYVSRDNPLETAEFRIDYDEDFFVAGVETLKRWRAYFEEDLLPEHNPGKRSTIFGHPHGWKWSYQPCQWCPFKKTCQLDFREGRTQLSESIGKERTQKFRPNYDVETARLRVRARWQEKKEKQNA